MHVLLPLLEARGRARWTQCVQPGLHTLLGNRREGETRLAKDTNDTKGKRTCATGSIVCRRGVYGTIGKVLMGGGLQD